MKTLVISNLSLSNLNLNLIFVCSNSNSNFSSSYKFSLCHSVKKNYYSNNSLIKITKPLDLEIRSITVYIPKNILKYNIPLDLEIRSITIYVKKDIIKYTRPFNSYNVIKSFSVYVKDKKYIKDIIPLYKYNLSRDILNLDSKYIIKFITTSYKKHKDILDLCNATDKNLKDSQRFYNADQNNNINTKYLNILWLFVIVLSFSAPSLIYTMTGVNIYDQYTISESIYSKYFTNIRITCAMAFWYSIFYLWLSNVDRLKLSIFNKPILWAPLFVGLDNKKKWPELNENEISLSAKFSAEDNQNKTLNTDSYSERIGIPTDSYSERIGIPIPGCKNTNYSRPDFGPYWDSDSPETSMGTSLESVYEGHRKIKFDNNNDVKEIPGSVSADAKREWHKGIKKLFKLNKKEQRKEWDTNKIDNSYSADFCAFNSFSGKRVTLYDKFIANNKWNEYYKKD